jgi:peptidoglycan/LPS O-acetylase OafA/YrhL
VVLFAALGSAFVHGSPAEATWTAPIFLLVIMAVAQLTIDGRRVLDQRWLVYCGKVSFCFYLVHQLTLKQVFTDLGVGLPQAALALVLSCGLAAALHHAVEVPGHRFIVSRIPATHRTPGGAHL